MCYMKFILVIWSIKCILYQLCKFQFVILTTGYYSQCNPLVASYFNYVFFYSWILNSLFFSPAGKSLVYNFYILNILKFYSVKANEKIWCSTHHRIAQDCSSVVNNEKTGQKIGNNCFGTWVNSQGRTVIQKRREKSEVSLTIAQALC